MGTIVWTSAIPVWHLYGFICLLCTRCVYILIPKYSCLVYDNTETQRYATNFCLAILLCIVTISNIYWMTQQANKFMKGGMQEVLKQYRKKYNSLRNSINSFFHSPKHARHFLCNVTSWQTIKGKNDE